jgi:hypothetical protein
MLDQYTIKKADYFCEQSDLKFSIIKISFVSKTYFKCKAIITNRHNGIFYEQGSFKIFFANIQHWKRFGLNE